MQICYRFFFLHYLSKYVISVISIGDYNRDDVDGDEQVYRAQQAFHHPNWMFPSQLNNDVALIQLDRPARFDSHVQPICLPDSDEIPLIGTKCYVTGK